MASGEPCACSPSSNTTPSQLYLAKIPSGLFKRLRATRSGGAGLPDDLQGIEEVLSVPRSPWHSPYVERVIGSIRRECLDNVVVLHECHIRRLVTAYCAHYHRWRYHQGLAMDCPEPRPIQPREQGVVVEVAEGGGLYRHYERQAA